MDNFCATHPEESAVGLCIKCGRPACYKCSLNVDQVVYCSLKCFNELDPPSSGNVPRTWSRGIDPLSEIDLAAAEEVTRTGSSTKLPAVPQLSPESEPSVILGAHQADEPDSEPSILMKAVQADAENSNTTILGMSPVPKSAEPEAPPPDETVSVDTSGLADETVSAAQRLADETLSAIHRLAEETVSVTFDPEATQVDRPSADGPVDEAPMPILIPGTRRAMISSSCFFHPDTSAIVRCAECRNPICSLCAGETEAGLVCSPSCGVPDPARVQNLKKFKTFTVVVAAAVVAVVIGAAFIFHAWREEQIKLAQPVVAGSAPAELVSAPTPPTPEPAAVEPAKPEPPPAPPAKVEAPKPEPPPPVVPAPEPPKVEAPKPEPAPVKVEAPKPEPPKVEPPKPQPPPPPPPPPPVIVVAKVEAPKVEAPRPPAPAPKPLPTALELDLRSASSLLRDAEPLYRELAEAMDPARLQGTDLRSLGERFQSLSSLLSRAQGLFFRRRDEAPDPALMGKRVDVLAELIEVVDEAQEQIRVPRTIQEADRRLRESTPEYHELIFRLKMPAPDEASRRALQAKVQGMEARLKELRGLYAGVKAEAPDPKAIVRQIRGVDALLEKLQSRALVFSEK